MERAKHSASVLVVAALFLGVTAKAQSAPPAAPEYKKYFYHYEDSRSFTETALNSIGLSSRDVGRSFALLAGISRYPHMLLASDRELKPAAEDIHKVSEFLRTMESFDEIVVIENSDVNYETLSYFLKDYFPQRLAKFPKSRFLFAYSGHGMQETNNGYLLTADARSLGDKEKSIPLSILRGFIEEDVEAGYQVLVLINACHSGEFLKRPFGGKVSLPTNPGAHAITAGGSRELTWNDPRVGTGSVFFETLLSGLRGQADVLPLTADGSRGDGIITVSELADYLTAQVGLETNQAQHPVLGYLTTQPSEGGFFFLSPKRLQSAVRPALSSGSSTASGDRTEGSVAEPVKPLMLHPSASVAPRQEQPDERQKQMSEENPTTSSDDLEEGDFSIRVLRCSIKGKKLTCQLTITNQGNERQLLLAGISYPPSSRILDADGNEYQAESLALDSNTFPGGAQNLMPPGVPIKGLISFEVVNKEIPSLAMLEVQCNAWGQKDSLRRLVFRFKNLRIEH
jgi:hypothetical protein